ncbi:RNA polymerase sigma-70 factor [Chitinophaga lutea]
MMDEALFRELYERHWSKLYNVCHYTIGSREAAEDTVTEVFISLWNNPRYRDIEHMEHYLVRAAKNLSLKYVVRRRKMDEALLRMVDTLQDHHRHSLPERPLAVKEINALASAALSALPGKTQEIFLLNREEGLTYQQIADRMNLSVKTVEYHMSKALRVLGQSLLATLIAMAPHSS